MDLIDLDGFSNGFCSGAESVGFPKEAAEAFIAQLDAVGLEFQKLAEELRPTDVDPILYKQSLARELGMVKGAFDMNSITQWLQQLPKDHPLIQNILNELQHGGVGGGIVGGAGGSILGLLVSLLTGKSPVGGALMGAGIGGAGGFFGGDAMKDLWNGMNKPSTPPDTPQVGDVPANQNTNIRPYGDRTAAGQVPGTAAQPAATTQAPTQPTQAPTQPTTTNGQGHGTYGAYGNNTTAFGPAQPLGVHGENIETRSVDDLLAHDDLRTRGTERPLTPPPPPDRDTPAPGQAIPAPGPKIDPMPMPGAPKPAPVNGTQTANLGNRPSTIGGPSVFKNTPNLGLA